MIERATDKNPISIAIIGNGVHVTADVDAGAVEKLDQALAQIKGVLRLLQ